MENKKRGLFALIEIKSLIWSLISRIFLGQLKRKNYVIYFHDFSTYSAIVEIEDFYTMAIGLVIFPFTIIQNFAYFLYEYTSVCTLNSKTQHRLNHC